MYPPPFSYHRPTDLQGALALMSRYGDDAKLLAGGQSLIPMMKLRVGEVCEIIDIGRLPGLDAIEQRGDTLHIGALATHGAIAASDTAAVIPALVEAAAGIADKQVRSMGTIGGGLSVADASGDWPTVLRMLGATLVLTSPRGSRQVSVDEFVLDSYTTCLANDEILTEVQVPVRAGQHSAYVAFKRAAAAFPSCSAGIQLALEGDTCREASLVLGCAGPVAVVSAEAEQSLQGKVVDEASLAAAAELLVQASAPPPDARGSEAFKRAMLKKLVVEAGLRALARSRGESVQGGHRYA
jgi:carbon-monoxide dehydrogenase medium subunit